MEKPKKKPAKSLRSAGSKDSRLQRSNWIWYLALAGVATVLIISLASPAQPTVIPYSELKKRIETGDYNASNLKEFTVGPTRITGKLAKTPKDDAAPFLTHRVGVEEDPSLYVLLDDKGIPYDAESEPSHWTFVLPYLVLIGLMVAFLVITMRRMGGTGSLAFGRSRARVYAQEEIDISFQDVAGIDEAVDELREVVEFLRIPERYHAVGGRIPKGVLLVGPPGTGKTLLAKAVAGEAGVPFFSLSGSDFVEMFVGVGAARVRDMFAQAEKQAPCIIFIDELDALGKARGVGIVGGHDEREQTLNALLVEMDGFDSNRGVIIVGATNRPETLDTALLRAGRFDRHVMVDRPDINGREAILKVHARNVKLDENIELRHLASLTAGFVGADLANLVNEAALLAARNGKDRVGNEELEEGVERVVAGLEKKNRIMHPDEKQRVAHHECGHAIVAAVLPHADPVHKVSILPRGVSALGYTLQRPTDDRYLVTQTELEARIQVLLGGTVAEEMIYGETSTGAQNDLQRASEIARSMVKDFGMSERMGRVNFRDEARPMFLGAPAGYPGEKDYSEQTAHEIDQEVKRIIDGSVDRVRDILTDRRVLLEQLSARLMEKEVIDAAELKEVMELYSLTPLVVPGTDKEPARRAPAAEATPPQKRAEPS